MNFGDDQSVVRERGGHGMGALRKALLVDCLTAPSRWARRYFYESVLGAAGSFRARSSAKLMLLFRPPVQAPKPSPGPHKERECLPLILILRNRLKYALTGREVTAILMQRLVEVDGKVRTDKTYPAGFMGKFL